MWGLVLVRELEEAEVRGTRLAPPADEARGLGLVRELEEAEVRGTRLAPPPEEARGLGLASSYPVEDSASSYPVQGLEQGPAALERGLGWAPSDWGQAAAAATVMYQGLAWAPSGVKIPAGVAYAQEAAGSSAAKGPGPSRGHWRHRPTLV